MDWLYHESTILVFIAALAVILFVSGLLHLLVRVLLRPNTVGADPATNATVFQGQLQQLFHLHDAGVDQSFIDTLPVFQYKAIIGLKDPFDCAVCLCEFEEDDKLRLLPECSHAFHLHCIDTWLLSHSTCPLCRRCLVEDLSPASSCRRLVFVLESGSESSGPTVAEDESVYDASAAEEEEEVEEVAEEKVVHVKLGKFRSADGGGGQSRNFDQRRCFSMGSYEYMMDDSAPLRVAIRPPSKKKPAVKKQSRRFAMSECDCYSRREGFKGFLEPKIDGGACLNANKESFSFSKIWMRSRMEKATVEAAEEEEATAAASRRAFSFRLPLRRDVGEETKAKKSGSEVDLDVEAGGFCDAGGAVSRVDETPSFARRTLLWVRGRQSKVGDDHS